MMGLTLWGPDMDEDDLEHADTLQKLPIYLRNDYYLDVFKIPQTETGAIRRSLSSRGTNGAPVVRS